MGRHFGQVCHIIGYGGNVGLADKTLGGLGQRVLDEEVVDVCVQQLLGVGCRGIGNAAGSVEDGRALVSGPVVDIDRRQIHPRRSLIVQMRGGLMAHGGWL